MDNDAEDGLHYSRDKLVTSVEGGVYTLDFEIEKDTEFAPYIAEGNYVTFLNDQDIRCLLTITQVDETGFSKNVYCEDTNIFLINKMVGPQNDGETPKTQTISVYVNDILEGTGWTIGKNESDDNLELSYTNTETLLARLRNITQSFGVEFYFSVKLDGDPEFELNLVKERIEGDPGFRVSTDDLLDSISRRVNIDNIATKLFLEGTPQNQGTTTTTNTTTTGQVTSPTEIQPTAEKYDNSKASGATALSTTNWNRAWVDNFNMNAADPPFVDGQYIDDFLRKYYSDSPLIGHGKTIKEMSDYFGIAVGAALGVWAKETTFGRNSCGGQYNFGCIMWTSGSPFGKVWSNDRYWINPPNVKSGIAAWFKLLRFTYIEQGQVKYRDFLNKYSPGFENNQNTFKNLMWAQLKSFGYDTADTVKKTNYAKESDNPLTLNVNFNVSTGNTSSSTITEYDRMIDKMIEWFKSREGKVTYSMSNRTGPNSYDCSSAVYSALKYAGFDTNISWLGSTVSLWEDIGPNKLMVEIPRNQARRGDLFLSGGRGAASSGANGHTGVFLDNNTIIHCTYSKNGIATTPQQGWSGSPIWSFRLNDKYSSSTSGSTGDGWDAKRETAVQRALAQVGGRYVWGGEAYRANDCSGLVYESYRYAGFSINHRCTTSTIASQKSPFKKISAGEAKRGDLVVQHGGGHVAILLGKPNSGAGIVHAATPALGIITQKSITSVNGYYRVMGN